MASDATWIWAQQVTIRVRRYTGGKPEDGVTQYPVCEQCTSEATVYAIDPHPGGWGGRYCEPCAKALRFQIVDRL